MMDFITLPLVVGTCVAGTYGLFELFARRKERLAMIEKLGDKFDAVPFMGKVGLPNYFRGLSFSALKAGSLMAGIGLGLLVGFFITLFLFNEGIMPQEDYWRRQYVSVAYGASVLLFGGISLLIAFIIERNINKKKKEEE